MFTETNRFCPDVECSKIVLDFVRRGFYPPRMHHKEEECLLRILRDVGFSQDQPEYNPKDNPWVQRFIATVTHWLHGHMNHAASIKALDGFFADFLQEEKDAKTSQQHSEFNHALVNVQVGRLMVNVWHHALLDEVGGDEGVTVRMHLLESAFREHVDFSPDSPETNATQGE